MIGIYGITHTDSGRVYIGSSSCIERRLREHKSSLRSGNHKNQRLQRAWNRYGKSAFAFSVVEVLDSEGQLIEREQFHADAAADVYNAGLFLANPFRGTKRPLSTRLKMSAHAKTRTYSAETREKMAAAKRGKPRQPFTTEHRDRIAKSKRADWLSRSVPLSHVTPHTDESKARMSASQKAAWARRKAVA